MAAREREFLILGPLEARVDGVRVDLGGPGQRRLLARLLVEADRVVPLDRLIDELWEGKPPATARHAVRVYASKLRKAVGDSLRARAGGYALEVEDEEIDARRFERVVAEGRSLLEAGEPAEAAAKLRAALSLWRGRPLTDFLYDEWAQAEIARLEQLHLVALEARIEADLALARHAQLVPELEALVSEHPLREKLWGQLMLALYRSGRQADALATYRRARTALVEELGLEPGPELRNLETAILGHDAALAVEPPELDARRRLPSAATPLVGRRAEVEEVTGLLRGDARLVTVTGPGGIGKTRVAVQAAYELAERFSDGVVFVDLAAVRDPELVPAEIATTLGVEDSNGTLAEHLRNRELLLLIDNFEQVEEAATALGSMLRDAEGLKLLVTSRHPTRVYGEHRFPLDPLALDEEAVPLFVLRAGATGHRVGPTDAVREICLRLDCLPLAIELVAARAADYTPTELVALLPRRLELAKEGPRDVPERHRTLRDAIEWSFGLLEPDEQAVFARLSVFAGGFTAEAAAAVCDAPREQLESLVDESLLVRDGERFQLLETIREYARELLEEGDRADDVRRRHAEHYLARAEAADSVLRGGGDTAEALDALDRDHDNLRAALDWARSQEDGGNFELRLATALGRFWEWRGHVGEGFERIDRALARAADPPSELHVRALLRAGVFAHMRGRVEDATARLEQALRHARASGDQTMVANTLRNLGALAKDAREYDRARALHEQALEISRGLEDRSGISSSLINLADVALARGNAAAAEALARESVDLASALGHDVRETMSLLNLGLALLELRKGGQARAAFGRALELCRRLEYREGAAVAFVGLGELAVREGEAVAAARLLGAAEAQLDATGAVLESGELAVREGTRKRLENALDRSTLDAAWSDGASLTFEQALDEATPASRAGAESG